ncbi:MAG: cytochrome-c oxidase, cbb3-type subunit III [Roseiarcus sp.]|jgi:cytochrome c oxidase cbb3-type subunit 3
MATTEPNQLDSITGQTTTGLEWDGVQELNTPLPRWWLWTFYATILFAFVYWVLYPAWPLVSAFSRGVLGYSSRGQVADDIAAIKAQRAQTETGLDKASVNEIVADKKLLSLALAHGKAAFAEDCAPCHGSGGQGSKGYRNLTNEDWLWGGALDDIQTTITHGIRADYDKDTRSSAMPAFGRDGILKPQEIREVASYVRTLSKLAPEQGVDVAAGKKIFADNCSPCHGDDGKGNLSMGAANLTDGLQLYGGDLKDVIQTIAYARNSTMPAWGARLDPVTIKSLTVFVHSLGAGQ